MLQRGDTCIGHTLPLLQMHPLKLRLPQCLAGLVGEGKGSRVPQREAAGVRGA